MQSPQGIYYFLGNIPSHITHALPLYKKLGGSFVVTSKRAAQSLARYDVPVVQVDDVDYLWSRGRLRPHKNSHYTRLDARFKKTYDFLNDNAAVILFYELFEFSRPDWLDRPKKVFLTHGNMLKDYMSMYPKRLTIIDNYNYMAALSPYMKQKFIAAGVAKEKLVNVGIARTEELLELHKQKTILRQTTLENLSVDANKPLILYAPTFWGATSVDNTGLSIVSNISDDYTLLFHPHPQTPKKILRRYQKIIAAKPNVIYSADSPIAAMSTSQLMVACDALIVDLSSIVLEALLLDAPLVFAYDTNHQEQQHAAYDAIADIVTYSQQFTTNATNINTTLKTALSRGISPALWQQAIERNWYHPRDSIAAISGFIRSLL